MENFLIKKIEKEDINQIFDIINEEKWEGFYPNDLLFILNISKDSSFKAVYQNKIIACIFSFIYSNVGYISFFLVRKAFRNHGVGKALGESCLSNLKINSKVIIIFANPRAVNTYKRYGFINMYHLKRFQVCGMKNNSYKNVTFGNELPYNKIRELDRSCYKYNRKLIYDKLDNGNLKFCVHSNNTINGYAIVRKNDDRFFIGPLIAMDDEIAINILYAINNFFRDRYLIFDANQEKMQELLDKMNIEFSTDKTTITKMYLGESTLLENDSMLYIAGGQHFS